MKCPDVMTAVVGVVKVRENLPFVLAVVVKVSCHLYECFSGPASSVDISFGPPCHTITFLP